MAQTERSESWIVWRWFTRKKWLIMIWVVIALPLLAKFILPIPVSNRTQSFYDTLASLPRGSVIILGNSAADVGSYTGSRTFWWALMDTIASKGYKLIYTCYDRGAPLFGETIALDRGSYWLQKYDYQYGRDYVVLPYTPGQEVAMASITTPDGFRTTYTTDNRGNPIDSLPIFQKVKSVADIDLVLIFYHQTEYGPMHIRQWCIKMNKPGIVIGQFYAIAEFYGTYIKGNIDSGIMAQAEFEYLVSIPGEEILKQTMQDLGTLTFVAMFFIGLVWNVIDWQKTGGKQQQTTESEARK